MSLFFGTLTLKGLPPGPSDSSQRSQHALCPALG